MDDAFAELHKLEERGETPVFELFDPQLGKPNPANYLSPAFLESIESTESEDPTTRPFVRAMFAKILPMRPFTRGPPIRTSVWELDNWREINQDQKSFVRCSYAYARYGLSSIIGLESRLRTRTESSSS